MPLRLITASERLANLDRQKVTMCIFGRPKVGKTSLILTLPPEETILFDFESGDLSIQNFGGSTIGPIRTWPDALNAICLIAGPDPARAGSDSFSDAHYEYVCAENTAGRLFGKPLDVDKFHYLYFDSISDLTRVVLQWASTRPEAFSERSGRPDLRGQYGLLGREVMQTLKHIQHVPGKSVFFVGGLDHRLDDFGRETYEPQTEGQKIALDLPYVVDQIVTLSDFDYTVDSGWVHNLNKGAHRALCCNSPNPWGLPAGDRSGNLDTIEEPHLGRLLAKIRKPRNKQLIYGRPDVQTEGVS